MLSFSRCASGRARPARLARRRASGLAATGVSGWLRRALPRDLPPLSLNAPAGPDSSPYEGGTFLIDIRLPAEYPFEPPKMRFVTKVWCAPSVSPPAAPPAHSAPLQAPERELCQRRHLPGRVEGPVEPCADPEDGPALRPVAAGLARAERPSGRGGGAAVHVGARAVCANSQAVDAAIRKRVRAGPQCCSASPSVLLVSPPRHPSFRASSGESEKFQRLAEMGFDAAAIRRALSETSGDEPAALEKLLSSLS